MHEDIEKLIADEQIISIAKDVLLRTKGDRDRDKDKDKELKLNCCLFVYGIVHCYKHIPILQHIYQELVKNTATNTYFDVIESTEYNKIFKPLLQNSKKHKSHGNHNHNHSHNHKKKRPPIDLLHSKSVEAKSGNDDDSEILMDEKRQLPSKEKPKKVSYMSAGHMKGKKSIRMDDLSDDTGDDSSDSSEDPYFEKSKSKKSKSKKRSGSSSKASNSNKSKSKSKSKSKTKNIEDGKKTDSLSHHSHHSPHSHSNHSRRSNSHHSHSHSRSHHSQSHSKSHHVEDIEKRNGQSLRMKRQSHILLRMRFMDESKFCKVKKRKDEWRN